MTVGRLFRLLCTGLLGVAAALLVACGSSGKGLIPTQNAGPLQNDFDVVAQTAQEGDGSCAATGAAIRKTKQDFQALPASIDPGLHKRLEEGISNLRNRALEVCAQPLPQSTSSTEASTGSTTTSTQSTGTSTTPTDTSTTPTETTPTATTPPGPEGGTPAPGAESPGAEEAPSAPGGGTGVGEAGATPGTGEAGVAPGAGR
jgi:hypothetical protein